MHTRNLCHNYDLSIMLCYFYWFAILFIIFIECKYYGRFLFGFLFFFFIFLFISLMKYSFVLLCKYEKLN